MKNHRTILISVAVALATIMAASPAAHAQERRLLVLIDASDAMNAPGPDGRATLFEVAKASAIARIKFLAGQSDARYLKVAVYTFQGDDKGKDPVPHTDGFVEPNEARIAILCLSTNPLKTYGDACLTTLDAANPFSPSGSAPFAHALCSSLEFLRDHSSKDDLKLMQVSASGHEDSSQSDPCSGVEGSFDSSTQSWTPASWQARVIQQFRGEGVSVHLDVLVPSPHTAPLVIPQ